MAQHMPAKRLAALELRQAGTFGKGLHPDDGIVTPVIAIMSVPRRKSGGHHGTVNPAGKLLHARIKRPAVVQQWQGLDDTELWIGGHGAGERDQGLAVHVAVSI